MVSYWHLCLGHHVISEDADVTDLDFDDVARDHIAVSSLGAHPEYITWVEVSDHGVNSLKINGLIS